MSYPRAEYLFKQATAVHDLHKKGWTHHQLGHSAIQHRAADGRTAPSSRPNPGICTWAASAGTSSSANRPPPRSPPMQAAVTIVAHEHKRLGRGIELAALAEQLRADGIGLEFLTGELQGSHGPSGVVFTVLAALSGMEREYDRDRTLEGHESARARGKAIGGAAVTDEAMLAAALHLRGQELSLRDIASRLVIATGKKKGRHPAPATVMRMLREHDEKTAAASVIASSSPADSRALVPGTN
jgi:hypothetical protein